MAVYEYECTQCTYQMSLTMSIKRSLTQKKNGIAQIVVQK